ncbi:hypothetical protein V2W45_1471190 [Cenococcum geophilum]
MPRPPSALTKRALRELDRRNTQAALNPLHAASYLRCYNLRTLKDVKLFTKYSSPDLSDLRNGLVNPLSTKPTTIKTKSTGFREFKRVDVYTAKEKQVLELVIPIIEGKIKDARCRSGGIPSQITPLTQYDLPIALNFFLAAKGPDGLLALYGKDEPVSDNNAYTITSIYYGGTLKIYTSYLIQPTTGVFRNADKAIKQRANPIKAKVLVLVGNPAGNLAGDFKESNILAKQSDAIPNVSGAKESNKSAVVPGRLGRKRRGRIIGCTDSIP